MLAVQDRTIKCQRFSFVISPFIGLLTYALLPLPTRYTPFGAPWNAYHIGRLESYMHEGASGLLLRRSAKYTL
jgi:hypothetical protein